MLEAFLKSQNHKMSAQLNLKWIKIFNRIVRSHFNMTSLSLWICLCLCCVHGCVHVCILIRSSFFQLFLFFHVEIGSLTGFYKSS